MNRSESGSMFGSTLLLSVSVSDSSSFVCAYNLAEINASMNEKFSACIADSEIPGRIGLNRDYSTEACFSVSPEIINTTVSCKQLALMISHFFFFNTHTGSCCLQPTWSICRWAGSRKSHRTNCHWKDSGWWSCFSHDTHCC